MFQDPFSSYNPIFKADHVFDMIRGVYFAGLPGRGVERPASRTRSQAVGLDPSQVLHKYPHQLSGGQLQRLLIARALLLDIRLLVADEIISMLDASTRIDVLNLLGDLKTRGLGILFITHDLSLGYYISERTVILWRGKIVEMGATEKVYGNPAPPVHEDAHRLRPAAAQEVAPGGAGVQRDRPWGRRPLRVSRDVPEAPCGRRIGWSAARTCGGRGGPLRGMRPAVRGRCLLTPTASAASAPTTTRTPGWSTTSDRRGRRTTLGCTQDGAGRAAGQGVPITSTDQAHTESTSTWNGPVAPFRVSVKVLEPFEPNSPTRASGNSGLTLVP